MAWRGRVMWRFVMVLWWLALPVLAAETGDRVTPAFGLDPGSELRSFHLPDALVPGGRLLRVQFYPGYVARPWDATFVVLSHADERPAVLRHEVRLWRREAWRLRDAGERVLSAAEIERIRQAFRAVRLCATAAERPAFSDGPMVQIEFANETRYCFASRAPQREGEPEFGAFLDLVRGLAGVEWPG